VASPRRRGGLGTGLAALLPAAAGGPPHPALATIANIATSDKHRRTVPGRGDVTTATLELLREMLAVDTSAYLHQPLGESARLAVCVAPAMRQGPDGFELLRGMKTVLETNERERTLDLAGLSGALFVSNGPRSRGVHLIANAGRPLEPSVRETGRALSGLFSAIIHRLEDAW